MKQKPLHGDSHKGCTLVEVLGVLFIVFIIGLSFFPVVDTVCASKAEPVQSVVTSKKYKPEEVHTAVIMVDGLLQTSTSIDPEEYQIFCGSVKLLGSKNKWNRVKVGDKIVIYYHRGYISKSLFVTGWIFADELNKEMPK